MNLTLEELKYIATVLERASSYTTARAEQIDHPSIRHKEVDQKIRSLIARYQCH